MTTCYYAKSNNNHVGSNEYEKAYKKHKRDTFHAWMLRDVNFSEGWEMPLVSATSVRPRSLIPFSVAIDKRCTEYGSFVHFYEDDFRFERVWNYPKRYLSRLSKFAGVVMPDFSTCIDFPKPLKMWNAYRNQLLAAWWQECGITVLPNARHEPDCDWLIEALPKHSSIAICGRALVKNVEERRRFVRDLQTTIDVLEPTFIAYYGSDSYNVLDYPRSLGIPLTVYEGQGRGNLPGGCRG